MRFVAAILLLCAAGLLRASEVMPAAPARYFNDYAQVVSPAVGARLNRELEEFEKTNSTQLVVAIFPTMQTDSSLEDYAQRIFQLWKPGQKKLNNGAILLVFVKEHKMRIQTGYGLEGAMPDVICKRITDDEIAPHLKANDFDGGMVAGVHAMMQAAKGEYKGTGRTVRQQHQGGNDQGPMSWVVPVFFFGIWILLLFARSRGTSLNSGGRSTYTTWNSGFGGGGGWSSGGGGDSGGGGFSGGGGDSGGGGASGSW